MIIKRNKNKDDDFDIRDEYLDSSDEFDEDDEYEEYDEDEVEDEFFDSGKEEIDDKEDEEDDDNDRPSTFEADIEDFIFDMEEEEESEIFEKTSPIHDELGFFTEEFEIDTSDEPTEYDIYKKNKETIGKNEGKDDLVEYIDYDIDEKLEAEVQPIDLPLPDEEPIDIKAEIISWIKMFVLAAVLAYVITNFIIINASVPTGSMEDTIPTESRILGLRTSYMFGEPQRGDIVVFKYQFAKLEGSKDKNYVKRIIGMPGERISIENGKVNVYKNGELVETIKEDYLKEDWVWKNDGYTFDVPQGSYLVLGDNRNNSSDTRDWYDEFYKSGKCSYDELFVTENAILGKVYLTYWPDFEFIDE